MTHYLLLLTAVVWHYCGISTLDAKGGTTREVFLGGGLWVVNDECFELTGQSGAAGGDTCPEGRCDSITNVSAAAEEKNHTHEGSDRCILEPKSSHSGSRSQGVCDVHSFRIPSLVEVDGVIIATADCRYRSSDDRSFIDTVARYSADGGRTWTTKIIFENARVNREHSRIVDPTVVVKNNTIFILVGRYNHSNTWWTGQDNGNDWDILMYRGTVKREGDRAGNVTATILWEDPQYLKSLLSTVGTIEDRSPIQFLGGVGNGVVSPSGTILFPVQILLTGHVLTAMMLYSADDGRTWKFSKDATPIGTTESSLVIWKEGIMLNGRTDKVGGYVDAGYRRVFESDDLGATWVEALGTISRVIGNSPGRNQPGSSGSSIKIIVDEVPVMLITQPKNILGGWDRDRLQLWLTDGNRVFLVGQISMGDDSSSYSSLLYTSNGDLYCLYEQSIIGVVSLYLAHLVDELEVIRSTVKSWKAQDTLLAGNCSSSRRENVECTGIPTDGLVGLLVGPAHETVWTDVYKCVNGTISSAVVVDDGLQLGGSKESNIVWPVGDQGQDQRYYFANTHFTLVSTIRFTELNPGQTPLLGFVMHDGEADKVLMLSAAPDVCQDGTTKGFAVMESSQPLGMNGVHQVALTLEAGGISVHLDGRRLPEVNATVSDIGALLSISRFFLGHPGADGVPAGNGVVFKNVLLYNRPLNEAEMLSLSLNHGVIAASGGQLKGQSASSLGGSRGLRGNEINDEMCISLKLVLTSDGTSQAPRLLRVLLVLGLLRCLWM